MAVAEHLGGPLPGTAWGRPTRTPYVRESLPRNQGRGFHRIASDIADPLVNSLYEPPPPA